MKMLFWLQLVVALKRRILFFLAPLVFGINFGLDVHFGLFELEDKNASRSYFDKET